MIVQFRAGKYRLSFFALLFFGAVTLALAQPTSQSRENTETITVKPIGLVRLSGNRAPRIKPEFDRGRAPDNRPAQHILMLLRRPGAQEQAMNKFIARQYDPHTSDFHHWLTPQEFGARFGPARGDVEHVTRWLRQSGFTVNQVAPGGWFVDFSGTTGQVARAFHTEIHHYRIDGQDHYANVSDPYIPASLAPIVAGFRALNDLHPHPHARGLGTAHLDRKSGKWWPEERVSAHLTSTANGLYVTGPQDYAAIYGLDKVWQETIGTGDTAAFLRGTGQTIGVVGEADLESADIQNFRDGFGVTALGPHGSVQMENPPASVCAAPDPTDNQPEGYLDAEWSGAMAPDATIDYVACGRQSFTAGADLAAAYIIGDAAHVQKIAVLSTSYGDCEALPYSEPNQFYVSLWQQAAVEGITVISAAGDTGADGCQYVNNYAVDGLTVVNTASTPYNIAAGGTDFSDGFSGTTSTYWSPTNGANFLSAKSYIPETPWNESCASPLVFARFGQGFATAGGPNGFCTWASQQPVAVDGSIPYFVPFGGGGGLSSVSSRPVWQTGVVGLPTQGGRAVPDISMFASTGSTWGRTLILCDSILANMPPGTACDFTNANDVFENYGGGTSFVAPAFAGIMALVNQKSGQRQGQANYVLYPLAAEQYVAHASATTPSLANCAAYLGPQALAGCYFHDVSATPNTAPSPAFLNGNTQIACTGLATGPGTFTDTSTDADSYAQNCVGYEITVTQNPGSLTTTPNYYGVLTTADNQPAYPATPGYDLATGLGSPNVYTLVNAPQWAGGGLQTSVALSIPSATITATQSTLMLATVTDQDGAPVAGGTVTFYSGNSVLGTVTLPCSPGGAFALNVSGAAFGPAGTYSQVFAAFTGGTQSCQQSSAIYYGAQSAQVTVVVNPVPERLGNGATPLQPSVPRPPGRQQ